MLAKVTTIAAVLVLLAMLLSVPALAQEDECHEQFVPGEFIVQLDTGEFESWVFTDFPDIEDPETLAAEMWVWADWIEPLEGVAQADPDILQCLA